MALYKPHSVKIHCDSMSAVIVPDIMDLAAQVNSQHRAEVTGGQIVPTHVALNARKAEAQFSSYAIATLLDQLGVSGRAITSSVNPGIVGYWEKFDDNGFQASGSVHRSLTWKAGIIVPKSISVDQRGDAKLMVSIVPVKGSGNAVVIEADNAALPSIVVAAARWTLGSIRIGNVALSEYTGLEIDFGNNVATRGSQSAIDDTHLEQRTHEPKITITGIDPTWFGSSGVPLDGSVAAHATDYVYLRKRSQDGSSFVANGTAEHIKFTLGGLAGIDDGLKGQVQRASETSIVITLAKDSGGNAPLIVNTASTHV